METDKIEDVRVLIVDDTVTYRGILTDILGSIESCVVVGTAANGQLALEKLDRTAVDLVFLDIEMPVMNGIEALEQIRARYPGKGVIMVSGINVKAAATTIRALEMGALDFVRKPEGTDPAAVRDALTLDLQRCVQMFRTRRSRIGPREAGPTPRRAGSVSAEKGPAAAPGGAGKIHAVAIGISTGGPNALTSIIPSLPANLGVPVLLVQHMPPVFTASLAANLAKKSRIAVREAVEREAILPNTVYIAPGGRHMVIRPGKPGPVIGLNDNPPENSCRPAVDVLFRSVATHYGGNVLAVIMTGMGKDGCEGVRALKRLGAQCLTQDESTCTVYGMPRAVDEAGLSDEQVPLERLAARIAELARGPAR